MIVRILTEGQYNLPGAFIDDLNAIDNEVVRTLKRMLDLVRENGTPLAVDELVESDLVLPEPDITLEEAGELFVGEGLVPG